MTHLGPISKYIICNQHERATIMWMWTFFCHSWHPEKHIYVLSFRWYDIEPHWHYSVEYVLVFSKYISNMCSSSRFTLSSVWFYRQLTVNDEMKQDMQLPHNVCGVLFGGCFFYSRMFYIVCSSICFWGQINDISQDLCLFFQRSKTLIKFYFFASLYNKYRKMFLTLN